MATIFGYNPQFISPLLAAGFPDLSDVLWEDLAYLTEDPDQYLLHYPHYSVVMHAQRRLPIFTAANIDGKAFKTITRADIFDGGSDKWAKDKRIATHHQWGQELYSAVKSDFDKGHMTKREDVQWGKHEQEAKEAARSTFYYTNAAPQHAKVNQAIWRDIEDYVLKDETVTNELRICVFTGPVLQKDDPYFVTEVKGDKIRLPVYFWKLIYYTAQDQKLRRVAFMVGQEKILERLGITEPSRREITRGKSYFQNFEKADTYQVNVSLVEELTGLTFAPAQDVYTDDRPIKLTLEEVTVRGKTVPEKILLGLKL